MALAALSAYSFAKAVINANKLISTKQKGRERALLDHVLKTAKQGNPLSVLNAMDNFAKTDKWFKNFGDDKGLILDNAFHTYNPKSVLKIESYCGYSAVRIASQLQREGSKLLAFEMSDGNCQISSQIIDHAGLSSKVDVVEVKLDERLDVTQKFLEELNAPCFHFLFFNHWEDNDLADYLLLQENGMLGRGSGICAVKMGKFDGLAQFKKYVQKRIRKRLGASNIKAM